MLDVAGHVALFKTDVVVDLANAGLRIFLTLIVSETLDMRLPNTSFLRST